MAVEPAITAAIASGNVPSEITAEYLMENRDHPAIVAILVIVVLTFIVVMARCFSRYFLVKRFGLDDGLAFLSVVGTFVGAGRAPAAHSMADCFPAPTDCIHRSVRDSYQPGFWTAYRVHTICFDGEPDQHNGIARLCCTSHLHKRFICLPSFGAHLLLPALWPS